MKKIYLLFLFPLAIAHAQPGSLDSSFGKNGEAVDRSSNATYLNSLALQTDGKIVTAGVTGNINIACIIARNNADGSFDRTFGINGKIITEIGDSTGSFNDVAIQQDGKIIITGSAHLGGIWNQLILLRYNKNGSTDSSFGVNGFVYLHNKNGNMYGQTVKIQPDGKIIVGGYFPDRSTNINNMMIVRFLAKGKLDSSFNGTGKSFLPFGIYTSGTYIQIQQDGKIVGTGSGSVKNDSGFLYQGVALFRLNANGKLDNSFGNGGKTVVHINNSSLGNALKVLSSGKIVVAGVTYDNYFTRDQLLLRFNANGFVDSSFGTNGIVVTDFGKGDDADALDVQTNGKIFTGGSSSDNTTSTSTLVGYLPNGSLDKKFGTQGKVLTTFNYSRSSASGLVIQPDGKILTANTAGNNIIYGASARYIGDQTKLVTYLQNTSLLSSIKVYPNPVKDILIIKDMPSSKSILTITNNTGTVLKTNIISSPDFYWKISDLKPGEYYLNIESNNQKKSFLFLKD